MFVFVIYYAGAKEKIFVASTPAGIEVKSFIGIALKDSVDFIRWKLVLDENHYSLFCNYGISKPNTTGFYNDGYKVKLSGTIKKENNYYQFINGNKILKAIELNTDLIHLLDADNHLLRGNGGWGYTLNNVQPSGIDRINISAKPVILKDSMTYEGRTPCGVPGLVAPGKLCYKLKWYVVLYTDKEKNEPTTFKLFGIEWRKPEGKKGNWKIITAKDKVIYQLNEKDGKPFIYLLKTDENVLLFADAKGHPLVGDEDYSYSLSRVF
ncbi:MAG: hypothetical protein ABUT20_16830 [Bacteroidota bacterium]